MFALKLISFSFYQRLKWNQESISSSFSVFYSVYSFLKHLDAVYLKYISTGGKMRGLCSSGRLSMGFRSSSAGGGWTIHTSKLGTFQFNYVVIVWLLSETYDCPVWVFKIFGWDVYHGERWESQHDLWFCEVIVWKSGHPVAFPKGRLQTERIVCLKAQNGRLAAAL